MEKTFKSKVSGQSGIGMEKQRYNRSESAMYLGVSVVTLDRAVKGRKISFFKIGTRVVFDKKHLDDFLGKNEFKAKGN